jgi:hypothetical protein
MRTIYIRLLDEGTDVLRPTQAEELANGLFKLMPTPEYDPDDEKWEFIPGSVVRGVIRKLEDQAVLIAVDINYDGGENELTV